MLKQRNHGKGFANHKFGRIHIDQWANLGRESIVEVEVVVAREEDWILVVWTLVLIFIIFIVRYLRVEPMCNVHSFPHNIK